MVKYTLISLAALLLASCGSTTVTSLNPRGTQVIINLRNGEEHEGELLALQDGTLIVAADSLMIFREEEVQSVELQIEHDDREGWIILVGAVEVLPSTVLIVRGSGIGDLNGRYSSENSVQVTIGIVGLVISAATVAGFLASEPQETFRWPLNASEFNELRLHTHFPYGISPAQIEQIRAARYRGK